ncbi:fimbrillin family protein [Bacteroides helcogenes]|uniref:Fimbrillin family protein n=1 Tax=Bacteroides helcogenes (strain ATCC 35417 / DSM 20613 / JCM 6297 / CCUG 15421 / P 36-108) TaxID=693979 RepID=E6SVF0_BACT6|nr:fimbrillin family protein [Bacteroides helcogenes]ADV42460.1 hypothetical protein Bache_0433 [Bacteroides helcogenes P 36-108]MDY5237782.1 fimbrillin family protein [Bacteroides helcogenes]
MNKKTFSLFVRRRSVRAIVLLAMAVTATLASCSSEDMTDNPVETLPEGMYPLTFTATRGEVVATPQTRVSDYDDNGVHSSKWTDGDPIKVQIGNGTVGTYTLKADGTINAQAANTPVYWQSNAPGQTITAWYPASATSDYLKDQSGALPYVLKATATAAFNTTPSLPFAHKLAKFRFKLTGNAITQEGINPIAKLQDMTPTVTVKGIAKTTYANGEIQAASDAVAEDITPYKNGEYYEVLLLPGQVVDNFVKIDVPNVGIYYYTPKSADNTTNLTMEAANCYTYDIAAERPANFVGRFTIANYFYWDDDTSWTPDKSFDEFEKKEIAINSCKDAITWDEACKYLTAGVYWDAGDAGENQQTFTLSGSNGTTTTYHSGLWLMKMQHINLSSDTELKNKVSATPGRPAAKDIDKYFFLPATGYYVFYQAGIRGKYWLRSPAGPNSADALTFVKDDVYLSGFGRTQCSLIMFAQ